MATHTARKSQGSARKSRTANATAGSNGKPRAASNLNAPRWTPADVASLMDAVAAAPTAKEGFQAAAKTLGKTVGTVSQKYYSLKRKERGGARKTRAARKPATASRTSATTPRSTPGTASTRSRPHGVDVKVLNNVELSSLVADATTELQRRMIDLEANVRKLLG